MAVGELAVIGRLCTYRYPHSHLKPTIFPLCIIFCHVLALHWSNCLWSFHRNSASSVVNGTYSLAKVKNHNVYAPKPIHIAATSGSNMLHHPDVFLFYTYTLCSFLDIPIIDLLFLTI